MAQEPENHIAAAVHASCTPREFEALVANLYEERGYRVDLKPQGADQGVDFVAREGRVETAVQVKRFDPDSSKVGSPTVRETIGSAKTAGADHAHIVTTSLFTTPARDIATVDDRHMEVELVDGPDLVGLLHENGMQVTDGEDIATVAKASAGSADGAGFTDELKAQFRAEAEKEAKDLEAELIRYTRQQLEENQDEIEAKVKELGGYVVERAQNVDFNERATQVRTRLGERSGEVSDTLGGVREGALERAGLVRDKSGAIRDEASGRAASAREAASERVSDASDSASEKADEAKEKASEKKDAAKDKASDLKDRFL